MLACLFVRVDSINNNTEKEGKFELCQQGYLIRGLSFQILSIFTKKFLLQVLQLYLEIEFEMDIDTEKNSKELGLYTGSNFFNASEDQLNNLGSQIQGVIAAEAQSKRTHYQKQTKTQHQNQKESEMITGDKVIYEKPRYGNHRYKTTRGFERANIQAALKQKQRESNRYYKNKQVSCLPSEQYFTIFSPGIFLFFSFLKKVSILFLILTLIYLFPIIYNYLNGNAYQYAASTFQVAIARMMIGNQKNEGSQNQSTIDKLFIMLPDSLGVAIFLGFYIYWSKFSANANAEFKMFLKRVSDQTIEVTNFGPGLGQKEVQAFFAKYGEISQVAAVKNYEQMIDISKQVYELSLEIKQKILSQKGQVTESHGKYLSKNEKKVNSLLQQLSTIEEHREKKNIKFYVRFEDQNSKKQVLKDYKPYSSYLCCLGQKIPEQLKINGHFPTIKSCTTEPAEIVWQNIHIKGRSRFGRFILQCILILLIITLGFIFISTLNISTPPTSYNDIQTQKLTFAQVQKNNTYSISYTWCLNKPQFTEQQLSYCQTYKQSYNYRLLLSIAITVIIIITKTILKQVMVRIAYFQRYKNHTELSTNVMTNLFVIYISTTVMITFLLQANIFGISFKSFIELFIKNPQLLENLSYFKQYYDFEPFWYKDIGYQIWLNWLILSIFPHTLLPFYYLIKQKIGLKMAKKQLLQKNVLKWIQAEQFEIQDHYANILLLIVVGFIFAGGIPFMIPLTLVALVSRYFILKYVFVRFSRIPNYYTDAMNDRAKFIVQIGLVLHAGISIWMFGVSNMFGDYDRISLFSNLTDDNGLMIVARKLTAHWYLTCLLGIVILCLVFHKIVLSIVQKILDRQSKQQNEKSVSKKQDIKLTQVSLTQSYKIQRNPNYFQILAIMKPQQIKNTGHINQLFPFLNIGQSAPQ